MAEPEDDVHILPPDFTLLKKVGPANLDRIFSTQAMEKAQQGLNEIAKDMIGEVTEHVVLLQKAAANRDHQALIAESFAIKQKAGQAGYNLVAMLANSLCNRLEADAATSQTLIAWHVGSIASLIEKNIIGDGGVVGQHIMTELAKINPAPLEKSA